MNSSSVPTRRKLALVFQALIVFLSLSGVAVSLWTAPSFSARLNSFSYYTIQSNLLVAAALLLGMRYLWEGNPEPEGVVIFKSGALLWILVTGVVYSLLLAWMSYPLLYMLVSLLRGSLTGFYPYWFLNPNDPYPQGVGSVSGMLGVMGMIAAGFLLAGLLVLIIDHLPSIFRDADQR